VILFLFDLEVLALGALEMGALLLNRDSVTSVVIISRTSSSSALAQQSALSGDGWDTVVAPDDRAFWAAVDLFSPRTSLRRPSAVTIIPFTFSKAIACSANGSPGYFDVQTSLVYI
jgi:hypothetical protein